jgi:NAD(P)-dependent dehydrogenase (short-subunit alcohol dehydrogenase family)
MPSTFTVKDSVAMVTNFEQVTSLGRAIVDALVTAGAAKVYVTAAAAVNSTPDLDAIVAAQYPPGKVVAVPLDLTNPNAIADLPTLYPDVTLIVNSASYMAFASTMDDVNKAWLEMQVNYMAPLAIVQSFVPLFAKFRQNATGGPHSTLPFSAIVNINSVASFVNLPILATYSASKAALHTMTLEHRRELHPHGTLVIGVYPSSINPKSSTSSDEVVAQAVVDALAHGVTDVFPDDVARQMHEEWKTDAKALERKMTALSGHYFK